MDGVRRWLLVIHPRLSRAPDHMKPPFWVAITVHGMFVLAPFVIAGFLALFARPL